MGKLCIPRSLIIHLMSQLHWKKVKRIVSAFQGTVLKKLNPFLQPYKSPTMLPRRRLHPYVLEDWIDHVPRKLSVSIRDKPAKKVLGPISREQAAGLLIVQPPMKAKARKATQPKISSPHSNG